MAQTICLHIGRVAVLAAALAAGTGAPAPAQTAAPQPPKIDYFVIPKGTPFVTPLANFGDRKEFTGLVYDAFSNWNPFKEYPFAGKIVPIDTDRQRAFFESMRVRPFDEPEILNIFLESIRCFQSDCFLDMMPTSWKISGKDELQCNHVVSLFRTNLFVRGIASRPVYFEFDDGDGGDSHTLTEVWSQRLGKWLYFDPFYGAYSPDKSIAEIVEDDDASGLVFVPDTLMTRPLAVRQKELGNTLSGGWHRWVVPNMIAGVKFTYLNPKIYGSVAPSTFEKTPAVEQEQKF